MDPDVDIDNKYLYLVHSGAADANYTAGKVCFETLRLQRL